MRKLRYEDRFIKIEYLLSKPKTEVFKVTSKCSDCRIGIIHWYPSWRYYTFEPVLGYHIELSDRCLIMMGLFVMRLNVLHKGKDQFVNEFVRFLNNKLGEDWGGLK